jgi:hypothetical protein
MDVIKKIQEKIYLPNHGHVYYLIFSSVTFSLTVTGAINEVLFLYYIIRREMSLTGFNVSKSL